MAHWSGIGIPKTNAIALEVSYTHTLLLMILSIGKMPFMVVKRRVRGELYK